LQTKQIVCPQNQIFVKVKTMFSTNHLHLRSSSKVCAWLGPLIFAPRCIGNENQRLSMKMILNNLGGFFSFSNLLFSSLRWNTFSLNGSIGHNSHKFKIVNLTLKVHSKSKNMNLFWALVINFPTQCFAISYHVKTLFSRCPVYTSEISIFLINFRLTTLKNFWNTK